jgi:alanine dehydrogenase
LHIAKPPEANRVYDHQEALKIKKMLLIIDISCDGRMGFEFAKPTSFSEPIFNVGKVVYYGVDHSPSLFYRDASYEIGKAVMPYLKYILDHDTYRGNKILEKAVDIEEGVIKNREIITFQKR